MRSGMPDIFHSGKLWLGLFFVLFPLGFLLYGVNDIVDAETDSLNPRKGSFMFGSRGAREQLAALKWQYRRGANAIRDGVLLLRRPRILWWYALLLLGRRPLQCARGRMEGPPSVRRVDSGKLLACFVLSSWLNKVPQLPWQTFPIWRVVCHGTLIFRRGDGHRARPLEPTANDSDLDRESVRKILDRRHFCVLKLPWCGSISGLDRHGLPRLSVLSGSCSMRLYCGRTGLIVRKKCASLVGLERRCATRNALELDPQHSYACRFRRRTSDMKPEMPASKSSVEALESALAAEHGGADRIELCGDLSLGGVTPGADLMRTTRAQVRIPIFFHGTATRGRLRLFEC